MISVCGFSKAFHFGLFRRKVAAEQIDLHVEAGSLHGLLGPNGAGKSTTIKAIAGLVHPSGGCIRVGPSDSDIYPVAYLPEHPTYPDSLSPDEFVYWVGRIQGLSRYDATQRCSQALDRVGLAEESRRRRMKGFSRGMLQRVGLASVVVSDAPVLLLDEPLSGLDPLGRRHIHDLIQDLNSEGRTILVSSHIIQDMESMCDTITIVAAGRTLKSSSREDLLEKSIEKWEVTAEYSDIQRARKAAATRPNTTIVGSKVRYSFENPADAREMAAHLVTSPDSTLVLFQPIHDTLESVFLRTIQTTAVDAEVQ